MNNIKFDSLPYLLHYKRDNLMDIDFYENSVVIDLFDTISYIVYSDFYTKRDEHVNNVKKLTLQIPVSNHKLFSSLKNDFNKLLKYMTNGEIWNINFIKYDDKKEIINPLLIKDDIDYNSIALLSGGLDSLAGTTFETENKTIFLTYETNKIEVANAKRIYNELLENENNKHVVINKLSFPHDEHYTERTRSLMFMTSTLIYADYYKIDTIKLYENGIMSLNPKFNFSRRVTKTTSPKTIFLYNDLLKKLGINIKIKNPFEFKTKGEIINCLRDEKYNEFTKEKTRTCSKNSSVIHFRNKQKGYFHCGVCIACILRQIGFSAYNFSAYDINYCLPKNLISYDKILDYENKMSKNHNGLKDKQASIYKFNEKRSLISYYRQFKEKIDNNTIYNYLDLKEDYFENENWENEISELLLRFSKEISIYINNLE